ncbi:hypothetical protein EV182_006230, partial [Spiromyces aspiralis]
MKWISDLLKADSVSDDRVSDVDEADLLCTAFINDALVRLVSNYGVKIVPALLMFLDCAAEQVIATHSEKNSHSKGNSDDDGAQQIYKVVADRFKQTTRGLRRYLQDRTGHTSASLWHVPQVAECIRTRQLAPEVPLAHLVRTSNLYDVLASPELRSAAQE